MEDAKWYSSSGSEYYLAYPMVCFCDIPLSRVDEHVNFYGNFGIGVTRKWAESNGLSPVLYIREGTAQHRSIQNICHKNFDNVLYAGASIDINTILANVKPTKGSMRLGGGIVEKEFYQENEWRFSITGDTNLTKVRPWIDHREFDDHQALNAFNSKTKEIHSLKIAPSDIKYLFVKADSDIPLLVNFIQTELDMYPSHDIKILLSRIISLETISRDL